MSPSNNQSAGTQPPPPIDGSAAVPPLPQLSPSVPAGSTSPIATIPLPLPVTPTAAVAPTSPQPSPAVPVTGLPIADDKDVIEPEWVHKAKAIVLTNSDDPYKQSEELTAFKADYIQKRYNKTVKLK
jgi:hypothetical protein